MPPSCKAPFVLKSWGARLMATRSGAAAPSLRTRPDGHWRRRAESRERSRRAASRSPRAVREAAAPRLCLRCEQPLIGVSHVLPAREGLLEVCRLCYLLGHAQALVLRAHLTALEAEEVVAELEGLVADLEGIVWAQELGCARGGGARRESCEVA